MQLILNILAILSGIMGYFILVTASKYNFKHFGLTLGGLSYIAGAILTWILMTWWPLVAGWLFAFVIRKIFGDPTRKN